MAPLCTSAAHFAYNQEEVYLIVGEANHKPYNFRYNSAKNFREDFFQLLMAERSAQKKLADEMTTFLTFLETIRNDRKEIVFAFKIPSLFDQGILIFTIVKVFTNFRCSNSNEPENQYQRR